MKIKIKDKKFKLKSQIKMCYFIKIKLQHRKIFKDFTYKIYILSKLLFNFLKSNKKIKKKKRRL